MARTHNRVRAVWIGTSGWTYDDWRGPFYPCDVPKKDWLAWYATRFAAAEVNFSFYRTPSLEAVRAWRAQTPTDFLFAWKASKFITHWKRLNEQTCQNSLDLMATRLRALGRKAGPVLFQLPPQFEANRDRLANFLAMLPVRYLYAFEFRHPSWYARDIIGLLRQHNVSLCLSDHHHAPAPWIATASHVYIRGTDREVATKTIMRTAPYWSGQITFANGVGKGRRSSLSSTMIKKAPHLSMRGAS